MIRSLRATAHLAAALVLEVVYALIVDERTLEGLREGLVDDAWSIDAHIERALGEVA